MKMSKFEKRLVNNSSHSKNVVRQAKTLLKVFELLPNQNFLEVGCGNGAVAKHVAQKYHMNVTGVDVDPEQIELAKQNVEGLGNIRF